MDAVDALILSLIAIVTHLAAFAFGYWSVSRPQPTPPPAPPPHVDVHAHVYLWQPPQEVDEGDEWKLGDPLDN